MATKAHLVTQLLAVTPLPPSNATPDELVRIAQEMLELRAAILDGHAELHGPSDPARLAELEARTSAWEAALHASRDGIGRARAAAAKARAYRQSPRR